MLLQSITKDQNIWTRLKTLSLPKAGLSEASAEMIASLIQGKNDIRLVSLDVSWNPFGHLGIMRVIKSLYENLSLEYLNLSYNDISAEADIRPLVKFMRDNLCLTHLDLSKMFSKPKQVLMILKALNHSKSLQALHINHTPFLKTDASL